MPTTSFSSISSSETDINSEVNQSLMDKIRGNLDHLYAMNNPNLLYLGGIVHQSAAADVYPWNPSWTAAAIGTRTLAEKIFIQVESGAVNVKVRVQCNCSRQNADTKVRVAIGGVNFDFDNIGATMAWRTAVQGTLTAGLLEVVLTFINGSGGTQDVSVGGLHVFLDSTA
jgi:hypothetical protein